MDEFEDKMKRALRGQRIEIGGDEIASARGLVTELFRFRSKVIAFGALFKIVMFGALTLAGCVMTFVVDDESTRFLWAFVTIVSVVGLGIQWQFYWMMLNRNAVLREIKRLELRIEELRAGQSSGENPSR